MRSPKGPSRLGERRGEFMKLSDVQDLHTLAGGGQNGTLCRTQVYDSERFIKPRLRLSLLPLLFHFLPNVPPGGGARGQDEGRCVCAAGQLI